MARKSRKESAKAVVQEAVSTCRAALYVRLSVEDSHTHSASIETQQMIIAQFLERNPDIQVYDTYIDNGTSGTTFHRPAFQKMLSDIESGFVNCVIVKDLSRPRAPNTPKCSGANIKAPSAPMGIVRAPMAEWSLTPKRLLWFS